MSEKNDYIQLPPLKKDTSADVVAFLWEYMKLPTGEREKVKADIENLQEMCEKGNFQTADSHEYILKEELAGIEKTMQKLIGNIILDAGSIASWVYVEKYIHHRSLNEMLSERKDASKFILVIDTWFEKLLG